MFKKYVIFILINFLCFSAFTKTQDRILFEHEKIDLLLGLYEEVEMPELPDQSRFKLQDRAFEKYVDVSWDNDKKIMRFKPKAQGSALLTFIDTKDDKILKQVRLFVNKNDLDRVAKEIKSLLGEVEGIEIKVLNNKVVVDGQIILPSDMNRIVSVVMQYPKQAVSLVRLSPLAMTKIANLIERDINNPEISVRVVNGFFILEGVARDLDERDEALRIAQAYVPAELSEFAAPAPIPGSSIVRKKTISDGEYVLGRIINHLRIQPDPPSRPPKVVQVVVHFVELQKSYQRGFSFQWIPTIDGTGTQYTYNRSTSGAATTTGTIAAVISNLLPKLNWAREHGHARVLKSVSMIVEDGNQGVFKSQREIPVLIQTLNGPSTGQPRPVGIELTVKPQVTGARSDIIALDVNFISGEVLESTAAGPLTSRNEVNTKVTVRSGQSAAIGGLVSNRSGTDYNKDPGTVTDPLFKLLASKAFNRGQSQFVVFITPYIKSSASVGSDKIKKKFRIDK